MPRAAPALPTKLGLSYGVPEDGGGLVVLQVPYGQDGGIIEQWNRRCFESFPRDMLRRGDRIL